MPSIEILITFSLAALLMNLSPGPSNLYVMARSIAQGVKGGMVAALGLATGSLIHVAASVAGLSVVFQYSPTLFLLVKLIGAGYLIYLGINYWRSASAQGVQPATSKSAAKPLLKIFRESVLVEVTNPKTALFFLALLPQFVDPTAGPVAPQFLLLGLIVTLSALPCDFLVAISSHKISSWLFRKPHLQVWQDKLSGSILLGMGSFIVLNEAFNNEG